MKRRYRAVWLVGFVILLGISVFFVFGGNHFARALKKIYTSPKVDRAQMMVDLLSTDNENTYGGIYAGTTGDRVWVWGRVGLRSFTTYEDSVFLYKDRCSEGANEIKDLVTVDIDEWRSEVRTGDYVVIKMSIPGNGVQSGLLREIHAYNYWPFLRGDIETLCAR